MHKRLIEALVRRGLKRDASGMEADDFYARLPPDEKGKIAVELASHSCEHAGGEPLMVREFPSDLTVRSFTVDAKTANDDERTIDGVISTEAPVAVYDWRSGEIIDEVLLVSGARYGDRLPLLDNHDRWSTESVLGSARDFRQEADAGGGNAGIIARIAFVRNDPDVDRTWNKVRQGHLRDLSVGYVVDAAVEIQPGQSASVAGRSYTAGKRRIRVATQWTAREVSVTPIGADQLAKMRSQQGPPPHNLKETLSMNPKLRAYLESIGLRHEATEADAQAFSAALTGDQRSQADGLASTPAPAPAAPAPATAPTAPPPAARDEPPAASGHSWTSAREDVAAERDRVRQIEELAQGDIPAVLRRQAIAEGWSVDRASRQFLEAVRAQRQPPGGPVPYTPSAHTGPMTGAGLRGMASGLLISAGFADPTKCFLHNGRREPLPEDRITPADAESGHRFARLSLVDLVRLCAEIDHGRRFYDLSDAFEAIRSTPSGGTLSYVFTTSMYAKLLEGWAEVTDTTVWCDTEDVPNFLSQEDITLDNSAAMKRLPRGGTADDASMSDSRETYKIARYARKFTADDQDIVDDRFGAIMRMPQSMGAAAARLRPDLVYSLLLANAALADAGALFNSTAVTTATGHANLTTAVLGATGLKAAILAMGAYRSLDNAVLNIRPRFVIVPSALQWTAKELLTSIAQAYTAAAAAATPSLYYPINVLVGENLTLVVDDRIGATGVTDPTTGTVRTGSATNWFLSAGGPRTVRVAYRRGTNRQPQLRSYTLDKGQWGLGWDINMDIGAKALDYRGMHKSTGAG